MSRRWMILLASTVLLPLGAAPAYADVKAGFDMWNKGDYFGAVNEWRPLAIGGDADAQFNLAQAYKLGRGVPTDLKMAESWYAKAAAQGHLAARDNYGLMLFQDGDRQGAMPYIEESAGRGEPRAQYVYGTALFNGDFAPKDWVRAYAMMTRASAAGIPAASASLAQMDKFIPMDQRQRGLELARAFEAHASKPQMAQADAPQPGAPSIGAPPIVGKVDLPPSKPAIAAVPAKPTKPVAVVHVPPKSTPRAAIAGNPPVPVPSPAPAPAPVAATAATKPTPPAVRPAAPSKPMAVAAKPATPAATGKWKVQLAAFSDAAKAPALWSGLHQRIGALGPYESIITAAGPITRLQAGPLASRAAADKLCASVKAAGQACIPIAP